MSRKILAFLCTLILITVTCGAAFGERPAPEAVEGERYVSDHLPGASALYVSGKKVILDDTYFYGAGYASDQQITDQIPNQYGLAAVVLAAGEGSEITLNAPIIVSDPESYANGVFAAAMAKITVNGGTIDTDNSSGHGIDATYMGHVYAYDTVIHTRGETSGALATDFGGGFITGERLDCTTESGSSPGIFCAGSTVILLRDSRLKTTTATGVIVAHDHAVVVLDNCEVDAAGTAVSGLQALPNAASSDGSSCYVFGGTLTSRNSAVVGENGGRTVVNLMDVQCAAGGETAISASGKSAGILTVNLWDTDLKGNIECGEGCSVTVNLYKGGKLTGEVTGKGQTVINVFDGGEYNGSFQAVKGETAEEKPVLGSFDDYLISCWASGSSTWTESRAKNYAENVEPQILENSAAVLIEAGASARAYDPAVYNPSENGVDLSLLNVGGAHGFTVDEIFGSQSMPAGGKEEAKPETKKPSREEASSTVDVILAAGTAQAFTDEAVPEEDLTKILEAGLAAPSAINQQPWYLVAVTNKEIMKELAGSDAVPTAGEMPDGFGGSDGGSAGGDFGPSEGMPAGGMPDGFGESDGGPSAGFPAGGTGAKAGLGDSPAAVIIYKNPGTSSPNADFDCGLAAQNMVIAAASLGYGVKIVSSPTSILNGTDHDAICEKLGVDSSMQAAAVLLIGYTDENVDAVSGASSRDSLELKTKIIR